MENLQTDMVWFMGVVEDINDPFKINRIKVRCFNIHPADTSLVPTSALPWAITTVGRGMNLIEQGDWAVGFFLDGKECQQPFVFGTFSGIPVAYPDKSKGFCDPSGIFPQYINEATTSRLARNENISTNSVAYKRNNPLTGLTTGDGSTWQEPVTRYSAMYPYNKVVELSNGLAWEIDKTPGAERLAFYHPKGSWIEMNPDGSVTYRSSGDKFASTFGDDYVYIAGTTNVTIGGDANIQVNGNKNESISGNYNLRVGGNYNVAVENTVNLFAQNIKETATQQLNLTSYEQTNITSETNVHIKSGGAVYTESSGDLSYKAGGNWDVDAASYNVSQQASSSADIAIQAENISSSITGTSFKSAVPIPTAIQNWSPS